MPNVDQKLTRLTYNAMTFVKKLKKALYVYICVGGGAYTDRSEREAEHDC